MQLNVMMVSQTGEDHAILSAAALEGAVARAQNLHFYENCTDIIRLAVRLIAGIAKDHCFMQGNKRTAFHAGIVFMELNDTILDLADSEENAKLIEAFVVGSIPEDSVVELFRSRKL